MGLFAMAALALGASPARAQTGVSDDRVVLPSGPGSLGGIGENADVDPNMGQLSFSVPIELPQGFPGATPSLAIAYSSGGGGSLVGMGWSMDLPSIERATVHALPKYATTDEFAANGADLLVRIPNTDPPVYRARYERGFVRYKWLNASDGKEGYWTAEYPDGRIGYFGADSKGNTAVSARLSQTGLGTFRYHLVDMVDALGHVVHYDYQTSGTSILPDRIGWVYGAGAGATPLYSVTFQYEPRAELLSDCHPGWNVVLQDRLAAVNVLVKDQRIRRYELGYEDYALSGGFTRLASVTEKGVKSGTYPVVHAFEYSKTLGSQCTSGDCKKPYVTELGSLGVDMAAGNTQLIDMNGDALPDIVDSSVDGAKHRIFLNILSANGTQHFANPVESTLGSQQSHDFSSPYVQVLDADGDGFTDVVNTQTGKILRNKGTGDWASLDTLWSGTAPANLPDLGSDFDTSDGQLKTVRFLDYNGDKRIDLIRSTGNAQTNTTSIWQSTGATFQAASGVQPLLQGFEDNTLELNDMNGDGLLDAVAVDRTQLRYRLNLGWGKWFPANDWIVIGGFNFSDVEKVQAEVEDINGDGLSDLVLVEGNVVRYWLNRNGASFDAEADVHSADVTGGIPTADQKTVLFADMNGNGSSDVVWIDTSGKVTYLELFPVRPNLLAKITNGIGAETDVTYTTGAEARAKSVTAWTYRLPHVMQMVASIDQWDALSNLHDVTNYAYSNGFYDGNEKAFRGFTHVEGTGDADEFQESSLTLYDYDVGATDSYRFGLLLKEEQQSNGRSLQLTTSTYEDCAITGVPTSGLAYPVRHVCKTGELREEREGAAASDVPTIETHWAFDGYGNVTLLSELGVTQKGGTACGDACTGDERYTETTFADPASNADRWIVHLPVVVRTYGKSGSDLTSERTHYYDGDAFNGLAAGKFTKGLETRVTDKVDSSGKTIATRRVQFDADGNVVDELDPLGTPGGTQHRRTYVMDDDKLSVVQTDVYNEDAEGAYTLRRHYQYDPLWRKPTEASTWLLVRGGTENGSRDSNFYTYDEFGRLATLVNPGGDSLASPTKVFTYDLKSPASRTLVQARSTVGGALDTESIDCVDGLGRTYQTKARLDATTWQANGFITFNRHGFAVARTQGYQSANDACDTSASADLPTQKTYLDALGRPVRIVSSDDGGKSVEERFVYAPLAMQSWDVSDTDADSPSKDTPKRTRKDGLGRTLATEELLTANGTPLVHTFQYDELGRLVGASDPTGIARHSTYDLLGRTLTTNDPDRGARTLTWDDAGNVATIQDARGKLVRKSYDGLNRPLATWDDAAADASKIETTWDEVTDCPTQGTCPNAIGTIAKVAWKSASGPGAEWFGYNLRREVTNVTRSVRGLVFAFATEYDNLEREIADRYPGGTRLEYTLDGAGRVTAIPGYVDSVVHDARGDLSELHLRNGTVLSYGHDTRRRLVATTLKDKSGAALLGLEFVRDPYGHVVEVKDDKPSPGAASFAAKYTYDALHRLTHASLDEATAALAETIDFTWDDAGRLTAGNSSRLAASPAHAGTIAYDTTHVHAPLHVGSDTFEYDAAGERTSGRGFTYAWDYLGRLTTITKGTDEVQVNEYGADDDRLLRRVGGHVTYCLAPNFEMEDGAASILVKLGHIAVARVELPGFGASVYSDLAPATASGASLTANPDGAITAADAWVSEAIGAGFVAMAGAHPSDVDELLAVSAHRLLYGTTQKTHYLVTDQVFSIIAATDENGAITESTHYYPFGQVRATQNGFAEPLGFDGKHRDDAIGAVYFGARFYDPLAATWLSPDPLYADLDEGTVDRPREAAAAYQFGGGNPVSAIDEDGHFVNFIIGAVVGVIAGAASEIARQKLMGSGVFKKNGTATQKAIGVAKIVGWAVFGGILGTLTSGLSAAIMGAGIASSAAVTAASTTSIGAVTGGAGAVGGAAAAIGVVGAQTGGRYIAEKKFGIRQERPSDQFGHEPGPPLAATVSLDKAELKQRKEASHLKSRAKNGNQPQTPHAGAGQTDVAQIEHFIFGGNHNPAPANHAEK